MIREFWSKKQTGRYFQWTFSYHYWGVLRWSREAVKVSDHSVFYPFVLSLLLISMNFLLVNGDGVSLLVVWHIALCQYSAGEGFMLYRATVVQSTTDQELFLLLFWNIWYNSICSTLLWDRNMPHNNLYLKKHLSLSLSDNLTITIDPRHSF